MTSSISQISSLTIGTVESVSPNEIKVLLDTDSPRNTALNTGSPISFPKINSFVLFPNEMGAVVGVIVWLGIERSTYPKRQGLKASGLIDLPFPLRKIIITPIGTLSSEKNKWMLKQGIQNFPSVGDNVTLPTREQTIAVVSGKEERDGIKLGTCPSAHDASITVNPDKLFGRHLAVLGNTGSGKSCTLAMLVRSSIETAQKEKHNTETEDNNQVHSNARFIILDPNGEYSKCFQDLNCRVFQIPPLSNDNASKFVLPAWMWNSSEWAAIVQAAPKVQKPLLQTALRNLRANKCVTHSTENRLLVRCKAEKVFLTKFEGKGAIDFPTNKNFGEQLTRFHEDLLTYTEKLSGEIKTLTEKTACEIKQIIDSRKWHSNNIPGFDDFGDADIMRVNELLKDILKNFPTSSEKEAITEDSPLPFDLTFLPEHLESLARTEDHSTSQFIPTLLMRIKSLISDTRISDVINPKNSISLNEWLENYIGSDQGENGPITVIDLSLIPYEILHLVIAVSSRLIFESIQRYKMLNKNNLPTVLVLEEAHTFVAKKLPQGDEIPSPADMCRSTFERIAREGRKFGLGLVISSQRPSELSETILSQCNSFLLHRVTNDRDQELISKLVPDTTRGLLKELPSLPTKHSILLGIASKIPVLIEISGLEKEQRPESEDPDFWDVWTFKNDRHVDWSSIANYWTGGTNERNSTNSNNENSQ